MEDEEDGDFDANELLNLTDYQNKRKQQITNSNPVAPASNTKIGGAAGAIEISNDFEDDDENNGWGDDWGALPKKEDLSKFDYQNTNLNKLSDA